MAGFNKIKESERALEQRIRKARRLLGIAPSYPQTMLSKEDVTEAYAVIVKSLHPDSNLVVNSAVGSLDDIRKAKDFLIKQLEDEDE